MESSCPSMMVVCAGGSKGNGRIQSREFPLKIHDSGKLAASRSRPSIQMGRWQKIGLRLLLLSTLTSFSQMVR